MKKKVEVSTFAPPDAKPVLAVSSLSFHDTHGNEVKHGSIITIERNYNYHHLNDQKALVKWNKEEGMFQYILCEKLKTYQQAGGDDFYGISSFKVCGCASCMDLNGQNIGNMYVCPDCSRVVH